MKLSIQEISYISRTVVLCISVRVHLSKTLSASTSHAMMPSSLGTLCGVVSVHADQCVTYTG